MSERSHHIETVIGRTGIDDSDLHRLLADDQRKAVLAVLHDSETRTRSALATAVAERDDETAERVETRLHHVHLPVLDEAGIVDYDPQTELVEPDPTFGSPQ
jgi:hypothetical protein